MQISGREYLNVAEDYALSAIRLLSERHLWGPRLFNDTTGAITGFGEDGRFDATLRLLNHFRATQRLPYGGEVEARWIWRQTEALRAQTTGRYRQSSEILFGANLPMLITLAKSRHMDAATAANAARDAGLIYINSHVVSSD